MTLDRFLQELVMLLHICLAAFLGFFIGFERKMRYKEAGIRTHTIVCIGAALMIVISKYAFEGFSADAARIAAQVVSGVGFLGAGIIVYRKQKMYGLTTAAGVWATAGVGMACGGGLYIVAIGATLIIIGVQCLFHLKIRLFQTKKYYSVRIKFRREEGASKIIKNLFGVEKFNQLIMAREGDTVVYSAMVNTSSFVPSTRLDEIMIEYPFIFSIERCDDE